MESERRCFAQNGEYVPPLSLTIVSLAEMAMLQYAREHVFLNEQPAPPHKDLSVLDALTRDCGQPRYIVEALAKRYPLEERDVPVGLESVRNTYGARTDEQATNIALALQDIPLRPRAPKERMYSRYEAILEDTANGLTVQEIAAKNSTTVKDITGRHAIIMQYYDSAKNLPTAIRRARESGHWPTTEILPRHTIAGIALQGGSAMSLTDAEKRAVRDRSQGMTNAESGAQYETLEGTQKAHVRNAAKKGRAHSTSELIVKASLRQILDLEYEEPKAVLTAREVTVSCGLVLGLSNTQLAKQLVLSEHTIKTHLRKIFPKIDAVDREHAGRRLLELQYFVPSELPRRPQTAPYRIPRLLIAAALS
jgi:DNA-binding NarL/FixJ family response regulator